VADDNVIFQGRLCIPGQPCGSWTEIVEWEYTNLAANITVTPDPPVGCLNDILNFDGNPTGGSPRYLHNWTGSGAAHLDETDVEEPSFSSDEYGTFTLIYTVSDVSGCSASDQIEFTFRDTIKPEITCPKNIIVSADQDSCSAVVCYTVDSDDNCPLILPEELQGGVFLGSYANHNYFYFTSMGGWSWEQANQQAAQMGGHLATITSADEQDDINQNLPPGKYWIGSVYSPSAEEYKWVNGEPFMYQNFHETQPEHENGAFVYSMIEPFGVSSTIDLGWFSGGEADNFGYIVEFDFGQHILTGGLASGASFPVATTTISYQVNDEFGNTATCSFTVTVEDNQDPEITCPENIEIDLDPLLCGIEVDYDLPEYSDNCPGAILLPPPGDQRSGSYFEIGVHDITFTVVDLSSNSVSCTFSITVNDYIAPPLGCKDIQISLDGECEAQLTPTMVLAGWQGPEDEVLLGCLDFYTINVRDKNGKDLGDTVSKDELNETLQYMITHTSGFTCWADVHVEDKIAPEIYCIDHHVPCLTDLTTLDYTRVVDNCEANAVLVNELHEVFECDEDHVGKVVFYWKAIDISGNESGTCTSTVYLERPSVDGVEMSDGIILSCSEDYKRDDKGNGYPHPSIVGVPYLGEKSLYPVSQLDMVYCNSTIDYDDELLYQSKCKTKIRRVWKIYEWWCGTAVIHYMGQQNIEIRDEEAPLIPQQLEQSLTTETRSCTATVQLPQLTITDNCNAVYKVTIHVTRDDQPFAFINSNGGQVTLPTGVSTIKYTALDECGNSSTMTYDILVEDETDPVAICDQFATVSIKTNGYTDVTAQAIDDGSFDECGEVTLKVRRMEDPCNLGHDDDWFDKVGFCCEDANRTRMVQLLVTDEGGNTNICMVSVNVQEKVPPVMTCPDHLTVECGFTFDPANGDAYFGAATIVDNCPANNTVRSVLVDNRDQCGLGEVVRTFTVSQGTTVYQTCTQVITFINEEPFYINEYEPLDPNDDVVWPNDYTDYSKCTPVALDPSKTGRPVISEDACDLVGVKYEDELFPFATENACFKIIRTWTIIDWCNKVGDTHRTWNYEQIIKVVDTIAPELEFPNLPILVQTLDCESQEVTLTAQADDCTPANELRWHYQIREKDSPVVIYEGNTNIATKTFDLGEYTITFTVEDRCGNVSQGSYDFAVETEKTPTPICKQGVAVNLVRMNGVPMVMVSTEHVDNFSRHECGYQFVLSFSADVNNDTLTFDCTDRGPQTIQLWATDSNGNTAYCETFIDVQDNDRLCTSPPGLLANVSGRIYKDSNEEIEGVSVDMVGSQIPATESNESGYFAFAPMPVGGAYQVVPTRDGDDLNGVSTLDVVMIQRHILGLTPINSPYRLIAADINHNGKITASDLTELRKVLLGINTSFPENTSWRFVDAAYTFADPADPWLSPFAEKYEINQLNNNMELNFVGIKVGDINGNAQGQKLNESPALFRSAYAFDVEDRFVQEGETVRIPVRATSQSVLYGFQVHLKAEGIRLQDVTSEVLDLHFGNVAMYGDQAARISVSVPNGMEVSDAPVFVIEATASSSGWLKDMISLGEALQPEVYTEGLEVKPVSIRWKSRSVESLSARLPVPNPWVAQTNIMFDLPKDGMVTLRISDFTGKRVYSTIQQYTAGQNVVSVTRDDISKPGVYVYELRFEDQVITGKMILIE